MIHLVLQMHPVMDDVRSHNESNAGDKHIKHGTAGGNGHPAARCKVHNPANQQFDKWYKNSRPQLEHPIIKQIRGVLLRKNLPFIYVGKYTAQKPIGKNHGNYVDSIHEGKPCLNSRVNLVSIICPYMNIIAHGDSHTAGMRVMIFLCANRPLKGSCFCMQEKGLTSHKTEDCA